MKERPNEAASTADFEFSALAEARNYPRALIQSFHRISKAALLKSAAALAPRVEAAPSDVKIGACAAAIAHSTANRLAQSAAAR